MGSYDRIIGVLLVGIFFNTYLFGLVSFQFITYYMSRYKDPLWIRIMVFMLFVTDTIHSVSLIHVAWKYCVTNYGNPSQLQYTSWAYSLTPLFTAIAAFITHLFLGHRIYGLTQCKILYGFIYVLAVAVFLTGSAVGIRACLIPLMSELRVLDGMVAAWIILQVVVDILIASILVIKLYCARTRFPQTQKVVNRLIGMAIQSGTFATIFAVGDLVSFLVIPETNLYGMFTFPIGRIYTNTLMYTLNIRGDLRDLLNEPRTLGTIPVPATATTGLSFQPREIPVGETVQSIFLVSPKDTESCFPPSENKPRELELSAAT